MKKGAICDQGYFINTGLTQVLQDGTNTYLYGVNRVAQSTSTQTEYFLGDALGSVRNMTDAAGVVTLSQSYTPYGEVLATSGTGVTDYAYTGEMYNAETGLVFLRARYYRSGDGRFLSRDEFSGYFELPKSLNLYNYGYSNPILYTDSYGHDPLDSAWRNGFREKQGRGPHNLDIIVRLFTLAYPNETILDRYYDESGTLDGSYLNAVLINPPSNRSWGTLSSALERLASNYSLFEKNIFVRDVGTLFAGMPDRTATKGVVSAMIKSFGGPKQPWVYIQNTGLSIDNTGTSDDDNNVHHWAAFFVTGYFSKSGLLGQIGNIGRECIDPSKGDFKSDILLGNRAARMGYAFRVDEFSEKKNLIQFLGIPLIDIYDWQHSFDDLFAYYLSISTP